MQITHYLYLYPRDTELPKVECLTDYYSYLTIIETF
jgi:hypothetical protein